MRDALLARFSPVLSVTALRQFATLLDCSTAIAADGADVRCAFPEGQWRSRR